MPINPEQQPVVPERSEVNTPPELKSELQAIEQTPQGTVQVTQQIAQPVTTQPQQTQSSQTQVSDDQLTLIEKAKGQITSAATWLAKFLLRLMAKQEAVNSPSTEDETGES